jgi:hypothetical protein
MRIPTAPTALIARASRTLRLARSACGFLKSNSWPHWLQIAGRHSSAPIVPRYHGQGPGRYDVPPQRGHGRPGSGFGSAACMTADEPREAASACAGAKPPAGPWIIAAPMTKMQLALPSVAL